MTTVTETEKLAFPFAEPPAPGEALEVAAGIFWIRLPLPMALDHVNVYALADADGWTLVDTGIGGARTRGLWQQLLDGPLSGRKVARVLLTHHHPDHVGQAGWFAEQGAEILASRTAWLLARMLQLDEQPRPVPQTLAFWRAAGMPAEMLDKRAGERPFNFADTVAPIPPGFRRLEEGTVLHLAGRDWTVRLGGGHAPDHVTLWSEGLVIGGDQLLATISPNIGVSATEPMADPLADWLESCERLSGPARAGQLVLPGHKLPFTGLPLRLRQLIDNHHTALDRLRAHLAEPRSAVDCFPVLFRRQIGPSDYGLAMAEAVAHLNHLHHRGETRSETAADGRLLYRLAAG